MVVFPELPDGLFIRGGQYKDIPVNHKKVHPSHLLCGFPFLLEGNRIVDAIGNHPFDEGLFFCLVHFYDCLEPPFESPHKKGIDGNGGEKGNHRHRLNKEAEGGPYVEHHAEGACKHDADEREQYLQENPVVFPEYPGPYGQGKFDLGLKEFFSQSSCKVHLVSLDLAVNEIQEPFPFKGDHVFRKGAFIH